MKALTLTRPWPWIILNLGKRIENRTWAPPLDMIGQRFAIHAGKKFDNCVLRDLLFDHYTRGGLSCPNADKIEAHLRDHHHPTGIVATARLIGVVTTSAHGFGKLTTEAKHIASESMWFTGPFGWVLDDVRPLLPPIPWVGRQRLWTVPPPTRR